MNPYRIDEPACVSFSGGRSSAYMLYHILDAHGGLPDNIKVVFANTGREMPETLDFVHEVSTRWNVPITWIEYAGVASTGVWEAGPHKGKPKMKGAYRTVTYETASRNGEPFLQLIRDRKMCPNVVARFCTASLKVRGIHEITKEHGNLQVIGIRGDEQRRALKIHGKIEGGRESYCPMWLAKVTKEQVGEFWKAQPFDLRLPNNNGVTDWGNCDLCFLKGRGKRVSIIQQRPDLVRWWIDAEDLAVSLAGSTGVGFRNGDSYRQLLADAQSSEALQFDDATIPCYCGD